MKRLALAAAAACLVMGTAQAQQATPWYGELGYVFQKVDGAGTTARPGAFRAILGFDFHPYFAFEGMLGGGVNDDDRNITSPTDGQVHNVTFKTDLMYGLFFKPKYKMPNGFEFFGRLGFAHTKIKTTSNITDLTTDHNDNSFAWGAGVNYYFTPQWYAGLDAMQYSMRSSHRVEGLTLAVGYRW